MKFRQLPEVLIGVSVLFGTILLGEIITVLSSPGRIAVAFVANVSSSAVFILVLAGGGYQLRRNELSTDRYRRIAVWIGGGFVSFVVLFALFTANSGFSTVAYVGIFRWAATVGGGGGLLIGLFEARAIDRAIAAERARIRAEEVSRQNERLEEFASIIAHDLRNPLNIAEGHIDVAKRQSSSDNLEKAARALDRMGQIIEETLTLAQQGRVIADPDPVDLAEAAEQSWQNVDTSDATLEIEEAVTISADPDRLKHLFENLFRNAVEHGSQEITVRVGGLSDGFYVEDTGPGIPEERRENVLDPGHSSKADGTGFGLAIVRQIVDAHGWELKLTESPEEGARFEVTGVTVDDGPSARAQQTTPAV